jgi:flagellar motility protein MotE (MotC chaperone)
MIAKLQNPFAVAGFGLLLSVALGVGLCWRALVPLLEQAAAAQHAKKQAPDELKKKGWDFWTIEIENLSNEMKEERARQRKLAEALDQRAARLAAEEKEFAKLRADMETLRKEIAEKVIEISADEMKNLRNLSQIYTNLTAQGAVKIICELDDVTAVKILSLMKTDVTGPIFEEMSKGTTADGPLAKKAAILSEKLRLMKSNKPAS